MERTRARVTKPEYNRNGGVKGNHANGVAVARHLLKTAASRA